MPPQLHHQPPPRRFIKLAIALEPISETRQPWRIIKLSQGFGKLATGASEKRAESLLVPLQVNEAVVGFQGQAALQSDQPVPGCVGLGLLCCHASSACRTAVRRCQW